MTNHAQKNRKSLLKLLGLLSLLTIFLGGIYHVSKKEEAPLTVYSQNMGSVNKNPLEYASVLRQVAKNTKDSKFRDSLYTLLAINQEATKKYFNGGNVTAGSLPNNDPLALPIAKLEPPLRKELDNLDKMCEEQAKNDELFGEKYFSKALTSLKKQPMSSLADVFGLFQKRKSGSKVDKTLREHDVKRFCMIDGNKAMQRYCATNDKMVAGAFIVKWFASVAPHLDVLFKKATKKSQQDIEQDIILVCLYDLNIALIISAFPAGIKSWKYATEKFEQTPLHNDKKRKEACASLINHCKQTPASVVLLQEASMDAVNYLIKHEGYAMATDDGRKEVQGTIGSVILYKKDQIATGQIQTLYLTEEELRKLKQENPAADQVEEKNLSKLVSTPKDKLREITYNLLRDKKGAYWLFVSCHTNTNGNNGALAILSTFYMLDREQKKLGGKKIKLVLGIDANTTANGCKGKKPLGEIKKLVSGVKNKQGKEQYTIIGLNPSEGGEPLVTTTKERSIYQTQIKKIGDLQANLSDLVIISNNVDLLWKEMTPIGPGLKNPSDHKGNIAALKK